MPPNGHWRSSSPLKAGPGKSSPGWGLALPGQRRAGPGRTFRQRRLLLALLAIAIGASIAVLSAAPRGQGRKAWRGAAGRGRIIHGVRSHEVAESGGHTAAGAGDHEGAAGRGHEAPGAGVNGAAGPEGHDPVGPWRKDSGGTQGNEPAGTGSGGAKDVMMGGDSIPKQVARTNDEQASAQEEGGHGDVGDESGPSTEEEESPFIRRIIIRPLELSRALGRMSPGRPVVGTISNLAFSDMLRNWFLNVQQAGMAENALVAALDQQTLEFCQSHGMPSILLHSDLPSTDFRRSAKTFKEMGLLKTAFVVAVLEAGWDLLMSDTDTVWMRDPGAFFHTSSPLGAADVMVTSDSVSHDNDMESQKHPWRVEVEGDWQGWFRYATERAREIFGNAYEHAFNTGVLFLRCSPAALRFSLAWHEVMRTKGRSLNMSRVWGDQHAFNELHRINMFPIQVFEPADGSPVNNRIFWTYNATVRLAILPVAEFCNGHVFFVQQLHVRNSIAPYVVHNTFQFYYGPGKVARFRHFGLWLLDPPEYYTQGQFLSTNISLPQRIVDMEPGPDKHIAALHHYYEGLRNAWAIALILNRTLIFPAVTCFCDRFWFTLTEPCRAPGADADPPWECPVDHFVDVSCWETAQYRPSNFLSHPMVPAAIRDSRAEIELVPQGQDPRSSVSLPAHATDEDVWNVLSGGQAAATRLLHISDPHRAFCRFTTKVRAENFDFLAFGKFHLEWCCSPGFKPPEWPNFKGVNVTVPDITTRTLHHCLQLGL